MFVAVSRVRDKGTRVTSPSGFLRAEVESKNFPDGFEVVRGSSMVKRDE